MALTRKFLSALGIEADKVEEIINAHTETVDGLKDQLAKVKADADKLPEVQKELDSMKAAAEKDGKDPFKVKYEALKEDFENYKKEVTAKETKASKSGAYRDLLKEAGVSEKRIDAVLKVSDIDSIELEKDGKIKGADKLLENIKTEWADFITSEGKKGVDTPKPPASTGVDLKTRDEIYKRDENGRFIYDAAQRQAALSQIIANEQKGN